MGRGAFSCHSRYHLPIKKTTVSDHDHKTLLPLCDEVDHDTPIDHRLIGAYHYDTCIHLSPYTPFRRYHGVGRGQPLTDPSPGIIPHISSPSPDLEVSWPPHLQIHPRSIVFSSKHYVSWHWSGQKTNPCSPVYVRSIDPSDLVFSLSLHRHSCISLPFSSHSIVS